MLPNLASNDLRKGSCWKKQQYCRLPKSSMRPSSQVCPGLQKLVFSIELLEEPENLLDVVGISVLTREDMLQDVRHVLQALMIVEVDVGQECACRVLGKCQLNVAGTVAKSLETVGRIHRRPIVVGWKVMQAAADAEVHLRVSAQRLQQGATDASIDTLAMTNVQPGAIYAVYER